MTLIEVMIAALLILLALGGVMSMNVRSIHLLRATHQATATSQMLQQRVEGLRSRQWPEISSGPALARFLAEPPESESEIADVDFTETVSVSIPDALGQEQVGGPRLRLNRQRGHVQVDQDGDLSGERMLLFHFALQWSSPSGEQVRFLKTVLARNGLTQSGLGSSDLGQP